MNVLTQVAIPLVVVLMMLVVGMELTAEDFRRVRDRPRAVIIATLAQLLLLPLLAMALASIFDPLPHIVAGMILVAASPGGAISNYYVYLAGADVALSVTLTAVSTVLAFASLPLVTALGFHLLLGERESVAVPVGYMAGQLLVILLLPTLAGMWVRHRWPKAVAPRAVMLRRLSLFSLAALVAFVMLDQADRLAEQLDRLLLLTLLFTLFAMAAGAVTGRVAGLGGRDRFALLIEYAARNLGIATVVGVTLLGHAEFVVFAAAFFIIQVPLMLAAVVLRRRRCSAVARA
jgi:BASS family bile acid:Na+ symporter